MDKEIKINRGSSETIALDDDPEFRMMVFNNYKENIKGLANKEDKQVWDAPIDLRTTNPQAYDLLTFYKSAGQELPLEITAALGCKRPVLIRHVLTPFPADGEFPKNVWALGYEFVPEGDIMNTIAVVPNDEVVTVAKIDQDVSLGLKLNGEIGVPENVLEVIKGVPGLSLGNAKLDASTDQNFQLNLKLSFGFRKVIGGPVGTGGALWKMYRQDERIDGPHALYQTVLMDENVSEVSCTVNTWAKQGGWLGLSFGAELWRYDPVNFTISVM